MKTIFVIGLLVVAVLAVASNAVSLSLSILQTSHWLCCTCRGLKSILLK